MVYMLAKSKVYGSAKKVLCFWVLWIVVRGLSTEKICATFLLVAAYLGNEIFMR